MGESRRKKLKYNILKPIAEDLEIEIKNWKDIESDKNYNHYDFYYNSVSDNSNFSGLSPFVKLETALMSYSFPTERSFIIKREVLFVPLKVKATKQEFAL